MWSVFIDAEFVFKGGRPCHVNLKCVQTTVVSCHLQEVLGYSQRSCEKNADAGGEIVEEKMFPSVARK